jgi:hypothetical protein
MMDRLQHIDKMRRAQQRLHLRPMSEARNACAISCESSWSRFLENTDASNTDRHPDEPASQKVGLQPRSAKAGAHLAFSFASAATTR